jgi:hypothetical protein
LKSIKSLGKYHHGKFYRVEKEGHPFSEKGNFTELELKIKKLGFKIKKLGLKIKKLSVLTSWASKLKSWA